MIDQNSNSQFNKLEIDKVFELITSIDEQFKVFFDNYIENEYHGDLTPRLYYLDMGEIARFIILKVKAQQQAFLNNLFVQIEKVLLNCDSEIRNLIVVGLFEGIQNIGGFEINYYSGFDHLLLPASKLAWDNLIDYWEGEAWRVKK